jgi:hypothetical protein
VAEVVSMDALDRAVAEVTPYETHFSQPGRLEQALEAANFGEIRSRTFEIELSVTVEEYLADRAMSARGRLARHLLGPHRWSHCSASLDGLFRIRFGPSFTYRRQVLIAVGRKRA